MTISTDLRLMVDKVKYELQYIDYYSDEWTLAVILTDERAREIMKDEAISKVRFTPILESHLNFTFNYYDLIYSPSPVKNNNPRL